MKKLFALTILAASFCAADTFDCNTAIPNVNATLAGANGCTTGGDLFRDFSVGFGGYGYGTFNSVTIGLTGATTETDSSGNQYTNLDFSVTTDPMDILDLHSGSFWWLRYEAVAPDGRFFDAVKLSNLDGHGVLMIETVCATSFADNYGECPAADLLGEGGARGGYDATIAFSHPVDHAYVRKFFQYDDASITRFDNGVELMHAPEPGSWVMLGTGAGLLALGSWRRRKAGR